MIKGPAHKGEYPDRWLDCYHALEPLFIDLIEAAASPYIDLAQMAGPIFEAAEEAGWTINDVAAAVSELAVNYRMGRGRSTEGSSRPL